MDQLETLATPQPPEPEYRPSVFQRLGIWLFGIFVFLLFLVLKLPEARIQNFVIAHIRILTQEQGLLFSAEKVKVGMILGPSLKMYNVELRSADNERQVLKIPFLKIRPQILSLLGATKKASISMETLGGEIYGSVGASPASVYANLTADALDLGATTLLKKFLPVDLSGNVDGRFQVDLDLEQIQKSDGSIALNIHKLSVPAQSVYGFNLPNLNVSETKAEITIAQGQIVIRNFEIGKDTKSDDIVAKITGDGSLDRALDRSRINAKAVFEVSQGVIQSFPLLDALLGSAKSTDGKYVYRLTGPLSAIEAIPGG